ncbi:hypothetical protein FOMPIDRAFT_1046874 [Fomitopsis schrenkii]|uniref:Fungal-type protein kinase domain-containing protein n=1 Tax=Fomitopsis schrenkii TaxID=2126942 RepID=S8EJ43_FOMSC|nr:hypothetical protein FOMPIDRAFT_1046874 [Fomitopsis schrenkii]
MPKDTRNKSDLYKPLCDGLTKLVAGFPGSNKLVFKNHKHTRTKFPYKKYHSEGHITRPDVIASFPGESDINRHPDKWRNISLVVEAKLKESEDPMKSYSDEHELTLVQLAKSARNLLVSQSRLFVFFVGIYGSLARFFRFDHAGAVCSRAFDYTTSTGSRHMYDFLWRFTHPIAKGTHFVGDDPTVRCIKRGDHASVTSKLRAKGIEIRDATEAAKAYRYITVGGTNKGTKRYLAYELLFMNPHFISRATTVWKAIEVDGQGNPIGSPVVIKDAWRELVIQKELDHYEDIFSSSDAAAEVFGVAQFLCGDDLGAGEYVAMERGEKGGSGVGHLTATSRYAVKPAHPHSERSHSRLVLGTVGVPLSQFKSTRELSEAFRDAVQGHQEAFEKAILHRDISEGNVMISRDPAVPYKGFVQDFDYSLNWQKFLVRLGLADKWEDWDNFVRAECVKVAEKNRRDLEAQWRKAKEAFHRAQQAAGGHDSDDETQATADADLSVPSDSEGWQEEASSQPSSENAAQSLGTEDDYRDEGSQEGVSEFSREGVAQCHAAENDHSDAELDEVEELVGPQAPPVNPQNDSSPSEEDIKRQCKLRVGTLYFKAVDLLSRGEVVHEVRHDLESFFWLLIWILLRHTYLGTRRVEFALACKNNCRIDDVEPSDPLTHEKVLGIFERALALEAWPTERDHARSYHVVEFDKPPQAHQRESSRAAMNSKLRNTPSAPISAEHLNSLPGRQQESCQALPRGSKRSRRLANAPAEGGSHRRKRSRKALETTEAMGDAHSDEERPKRVKMNSERHGDAAQGRRKGSRVRSGRELE